MAVGACPGPRSGAAMTDEGPNMSDGTLSMTLAPVHAQAADLPVRSPKRYLRECLGDRLGVYRSRDTQRGQVQGRNRQMSVRLALFRADLIAETKTREQ